jgi:hypothetical protein
LKFKFVLKFKFALHHLNARIDYVYRIEINLGHYRVLYSAAMKGGRSKAKRSAAAIDELLENDDEESTRTNNGTKPKTAAPKRSKASVTAAVLAVPPPVVAGNVAPPVLAVPPPVVAGNVAPPVLAVPPPVVAGNVAPPVLAVSPEKVPPEAEKTGDIVDKIFAEQGKERERVIGIELRMAYCLNEPYPYSSGLKYIDKLMGNKGTDEGEIDNRKALTKTKQVLHELEKIMADPNITFN